jgi:hypothetical protein
MFWRPSAREWFEFPKYKMLEDDKRFSQFDEDRDPREGDSQKIRLSDYTHVLQQIGRHQNHYHDDCREHPGADH